MPLRSFLLLCTLLVPWSGPLTAQVVPQRRIVSVRPGVALEALDWGGKGPTLLFLAGITFNAHSFAAFAPLLTDHFHVLGLTRRGAGTSTPARPGVTLDTLADDIAAALDSLHFAHVVLAGHSYAGAELTVFATRYPGRASALIYIDALYDTGPSFPAPDWFRVISQAFLPEVKAQPSLEDYRENVALQGCPFPPEAIPAHWLADSNGGYIRDIADSASTQAILGAPDVQLQYSAIQMPVLALYPIWRSSFDLPWSSTIGDTLRIRADNAVFLWEALRRRARLYFASQVPQAIFQGIPAAGHCMFMTHPREVAASIDAFLQQAPQ